MSNADLATLHEAASIAGIDHVGARLIGESENLIYLLPEHRVARVARPGQEASALKEVEVAKWLEDCSVPAVRVLRYIEQPIIVHGRAVTFWRELPSHQEGDTVDVARALSRLHGLRPPTTFKLPRLAPFVRLHERVESATTLSANDRAWMLGKVVDLEVAYSNLPAGLPECVVHGDAWAGNVVRTGDGTVTLLDFERCSVGRPEWDLVSTAVSYVTAGWMRQEEWAAYCNAYGADVTDWEGFATLRDIRELRMATMAAQLAAQNPARYAEQAAHRVACLRGTQGPRPWSGWRAVP